MRSTLRIIAGTTLFILVVVLAEDAGNSILASYGYALGASALAWAMVFTTIGEGY